MKRYFSLLLCLLVLLTGCAGINAPAATTADTASATEPVATEPPPMSPYAVAAMESGNMHYYFYTSDGQTVNTGTYQTTGGDATLIFFPNGEIMLIDSSTTTGYPIFKAWLESMGVWKIDYLVMSHNQSDHAGGINAGLIFDFEIGMLYHNGTKNDVLWTCLDHDIPFTEMKLDDTLEIGSGDQLVTVKCLWPTAEGRVNGSSNAAKNTSLVLRFDFGEHSSLFPGDICKTWEGAFKDREEKGVYNVAGQIGAEERLAEMYQNGELDVDLLKLSNHGNPSTSNGKALWDSTTPELAVAMGFYPLDTGYITAYNAWGYKGDVLFDRKHGFIHVTAQTDGTMTPETSRDDYKEPFGDHWNTEIGG